MQKERSSLEDRSTEKNLKARIAELTALYEVSKSITSSVNLDKVLKLIVKKVARIIKADVCMVHLLNKNDLRLKTSYARKGIRCKLRERIPLKDGVIAHAIMRQKAVNIRDLSKSPRSVCCEISKTRPHCSLLIVPLIEKEKVIGTLTCCCTEACKYTKNDEEELSLFASQAAVAIENARLFEEIRVNYLNTMKLLASVIDAKDTYTEDHSERVMRTALGVANILGLSDKQKSIIRYASLLHDIGKIGIDISILRKPAPLTRAEWAEMRKHPRAGADIIRKAGFLDDLIPTILYHHVNYCGGGYPPTKKKRNHIPIEARILAAADAYEAMRSDRPYRRHLSKEQAIAELKRNSGKQFDPKVVRAFLKHLNR